MRVQVKVAVKVQIHFSHPQKLVPRPRELSTSRNTLTSEKGRYAANKILYLFAQHYYQCTLIGTPGTGNKTQCFPFFFFFLVINSLREHPFFSALVSSLLFGVREATTGNTSAVRRLAQFKKVENVSERERWSSPWKHNRHGLPNMDKNKFRLSQALFV